jgi:large subunit ribosomal protein L3
MPLGLLGLKVGMTQVYDDQGKLAPVTVLQVGPCPVLQIRDPERDGYHAVQLGFKDKERRKATRGERGHVSGELESKRRRARAAAGVALPPKADVEPQRYIREFRLTEAAGDVKVGALLTVGTVFANVAAVDVTGTSKGRGTTGAMKRHGFAGLPASHGVKKHHRAPGSVGSHASNRGSGRPKKGKRMAGRYGAERVTARNLRVVRIDGDNHVLLVQGAVPGPNGGLVLVRPTNKKG